MKAKAKDVVDEDEDEDEVDEERKKNDRQTHAKGGQSSIVILYINLYVTAGCLFPCIGTSIARQYCIMIYHDDDVILMQSRDPVLNHWNFFLSSSNPLASLSSSISCFILIFSALISNFPSSWSSALFIA